jgi:hypothetical protein
VTTRTLAMVGVAVAAWCAVGIPAPASAGSRVTADEPHYLLTATSLGEDFSLDVSDERADARYRPYHRVDLLQQELVRHNGAQVSPHDPLLPAVLALPMRFGGWIAAKLVLAALAGILAAALVWVAIVRFRVPRRAAVVTVLAFACAPPLAFYGTQVYPELPAALAVTLAIAALTGPLQRRGLLLVGACVVALPWLAVKYVPVATVLAGCALWRKRSPQLVVGLLIAGAAFAVAHLAWYGGLTPYASGEHFTGGQLTVVGRDPNYFGRSIRLVGLLLDRDFGLAAWQPGFLLAVPAAAALLRRRPRGWSVLALVFAAGWCNAAFVALTMHGWWWPGRQTVVILPCVVLAVACWAATSPAAVRVLAVLGVFGASVYAWFVAQAIFGGLTIVVSFETVSHPLVRAWRLLLPDYRDLSARDWMLHCAWLVVIAGVALRASQIRIPFVRTRLQGVTSP